MIYTVTFNPSLDYIVKLPTLALGGVNRTEAEELYPGGKGINVSIVLRNLGVESTALGFTAGFTGNEICRLLDRCGCRTDFIQVPEGFSRINVKIQAEQESEINGQGPNLTTENLQNLFQKLDQLLDGDLLVLAGSIPNTLPSNIYERILQQLEGRNIRVVVDATGELLRNVLKYHPFLIKPNNHELGDLFGQSLRTDQEIIFYAQKLQQMGARNVLISMAGDGAILVDEGGTIHKSPPPKGKVVNSVGAGDSMVAGFLAGYLSSHNYETAFKTGLAAGSASAFQEWLASGADIRKLLKTL